MTRPRTNICLNMIVKNEEKVLPRLFRSVKDYIDYYVIVDTGSSDGTIDLIKREMAQYGIEGEVHEREWVNFGVNRQQALELAVQAAKTDWVLFIDADEELGVSDPKFYEKLEPGVGYDIEKHHEGVRYAVPHLLNIKANRYEWRGPVHNYIMTLEGPKKRPLRRDVWIVYHLGEGAKSHGVTHEEKHLRDARLLEKDLEENPDNPRSQFYLGQSYRDAGHLDKAYEAYQKRVQMKGWEEERFVSQLEMGRIAVRRDDPEEVVLRDLLGAYELRATRAEPLHELAKYFRSKKMWGKAFCFAKAGINTRKPDDKLFVAQAIYDWMMADELAVSASWVGDYEVSKLASEHVLLRVEEGLNLPEEEVQRVRNNLAYVSSKLAEASDDSTNE